MIKTVISSSLAIVFSVLFFDYQIKEWKTRSLSISHDYIIDTASDIIVEMEGLKLKPYNGLGHKEVAICYGNSFYEYKKRFKTEIGSKKNCDIMLKEKIEQFFNDIKKDELFLKYDTQYIALISLAYNLRGNYNAIKKTRLYKNLKSNQDIDKIITEWLDFSHVQGNIVCGLLNRNANALIVFFGNFEDKKKDYAYNKIRQELSTYKDYNCKFNIFFNSQIIT